MDNHAEGELSDGFTSNEDTVRLLLRHAWRRSRLMKIMAPVLARPPCQRTSATSAPDSSSACSALDQYTVTACHTGTSLAALDSALAFRAGARLRAAATSDEVPRRSPTTSRAIGEGNRPCAVRALVHRRDKAMIALAVMRRRQRAGRLGCGNLAAPTPSSVVLL